MNRATAKLLRKVAKARGTTRPRDIRALKRDWYSLNRKERTQRRKEYEEEIA